MIPCPNLGAIKERGGIRAERMHRLWCYNTLKVNEVCWDKVLRVSVIMKHLIFFLQIKFACDIWLSWCCQNHKWKEIIKGAFKVLLQLFDTLESEDCDCLSLR